MYRKVERHAVAGAEPISRAGNPVQLRASGVKRVHGTHDVVQIHDASNPVAAPLRNETYCERSSRSGHRRYSK